MRWGKRERWKYVDMRERGNGRNIEPGKHRINHFLQLVSS